MATLFTLPIPTGGEFVCTKPADRVYLLSFSSPPDNRLTTPFIQTYLLALDIIEHKYQTGVLISTSSIQKFFSNGLDLGHVSQTPGFLPDSLYPLFRRLLTYPMPTVALINGHAFAGGLMIAMYHDYRVQNPAKGFLCLNEVLFGAIMNPPMVGIFREKVNPIIFRTLILEGKRVSAQEALQERMVDALGGLDEALKLIEQRALIKMGEAGAYGGLKEEMYRATLALLRGHEENVKWRDDLESENAKLKKVALAKIEKWEAGSQSKI